MADLERRGSHTPRRTREQRAYWLVLVAGGAGLVGGFTLILAIFGTVGWGLPILALIVAAVCLLLFRRTVSG